LIKFSAIGAVVTLATHDQPIHQLQRRAAAALIRISMSARATSAVSSKSPKFIDRIPPPFNHSQFHADHADRHSRHHQGRADHQDWAVIVVGQRRKSATLPKPLLCALQARETASR
jgi:hypothetical protein